jgi:hypothetical protein
MQLISKQAFLHPKAMKVHTAFPIMIPQFPHYQPTPAEGTRSCTAFKSSESRWSPHIPSANNS